MVHLCSGSSCKLKSWPSSSLGRQGLCSETEANNLGFKLFEVDIFIYMLRCGSPPVSWEKS